MSEIQESQKDKYVNTLFLPKIPILSSYQVSLQLLEKRFNYNSLKSRILGKSCSSLQKANSRTDYFVNIFWFIRLR